MISILLNKLSKNNDTNPTARVCRLAFGVPARSDVVLGRRTVELAVGETVGIAPSFCPVSLLGIIRVITDGKTTENLDN